LAQVILAQAFRFRRLEFSTFIRFEFHIRVDLHPSRLIAFPKMPKLSMMHAGLLLLAMVGAMASNTSCEMDGCSGDDNTLLQLQMKTMNQQNCCVAPGSPGCWSYVVMARYTDCSPGSDITTVGECGEAAASVGVQYRESGDYKDDVRWCIYKDPTAHPQPGAYFNTNTGHSSYSSIPSGYASQKLSQKMCKTATPPCPVPTPRPSPPPPLPTTAPTEGCIDESAREHLSAKCDDPKRGPRWHFCYELETVLGITPNHDNCNKYWSREPLNAGAGALVCLYDDKKKRCYQGADWDMCDGTYPATPTAKELCPDGAKGGKGAKGS